MADAPATQQPEVLNPDAAFATIHHRVYAPVLFTKLANDYGIRPRNDQERAQMLSMAQELRAAHDQNLEKRGDAQTQLLARAQHQLHGTLAESGIDLGQEDALSKQAALEISGDPELAHAVLSLHAAHAQAAAQ